MAESSHRIGRQVAAIREGIRALDERVSPRERREDEFRVALPVSERHDAESCQDGRACDECEGDEPMRTVEKILDCIHGRELSVRLLC